MRSVRVCELALSKGWPERVLKSMLGKCGQMWACAKRLCYQTLCGSGEWGVGGGGKVMELRLVTYYFPPLFARLLLPPSFPQSHPITIPY